MKDKILAQVVVFFMLTGTGHLMAKERHGAEIVIQKQTGHQIRGELLAVKQNSLLLLEPETGADVSVDIKDVNFIKIVRKSDILLGAGLGFFMGASVGVIGGFGEVTTAETREPAAASIVGAFGIPAALLGGIISSIIGMDKTILIEGKSLEEIKGILEKLRPKARITDFL